MVDQHLKQMFWAQFACGEAVPFPNRGSPAFQARHLSQLWTKIGVQEWRSSTLSYLTPDNFLDGISARQEPLRSVQIVRNEMIILALDH